MKKIKVSLCALSIALMLNGSSKIEQIVPKYEVITNTKDIMYSVIPGVGDIYISDESTINQLIENGLDGIFIVDYRNMKDPTMTIMSSYDITSTEKMKAILALLEHYEKERPSKWERTEESMLTEWRFHNFLHTFNYHLSQTESVDFNNDDEDDYLDYNLWNLFIKGENKATETKKNKS